MTQTKQQRYNAKLKSVGMTRKQYWGTDAEHKALREYLKQLRVKQGEKDED